MRQRKAPLAISDKDLKELEILSRSRTEPANRIQRATILLKYAMGEKITSIARQLNTTRHLV